MFATPNVRVPTPVLVNPPLPVTEIGELMVMPPFVCATVTTASSLPKATASNPEIVEVNEEVPGTPVARPLASAPLESVKVFPAPAPVMVWAAAGTRNREFSVVLSNPVSAVVALFTLSPAVAAAMVAVYSPETNGRKLACVVS